MAHVKIVYASRTGETEAIANLIAEGVRIGDGDEACVAAYVLNLPNNVASPTFRANV